MPLLGTKLHLPSPRRRLVERARLTDQLGGGGDAARLILVSAPAGFGKTTLLSQWLAGVEEAYRVTWLALDHGDADVRTFLKHLIAAVQTVEPRVGVDISALLEAGGAIPVEAVLVGLINDLDTLAGPLVLALDDYHLVDAAAVHEAVTFLLDNLPPRVTLAIATRVDPPIPLARMRARGELVEVRAADLRFSVAEAAEFLNDVMDLDLEPTLVGALEERTEGWPAGLQLAALSVRSRAGVGGGWADVAGFVEAFSGSHRFVLDYLLEEVLDRQPDGVRAFLLETSVLDQMTGDLCDALTGHSDGRRMLEVLESENLFVVPLDDERRWYRYHHLFADALRVRLAFADNDRVAELHAAASRWLAENGLLVDAVGHAIRSGDDEQAADLVELSVADLRRNRRDRTLREWLAVLPEAVLRRRPLLATYMGWTRLSDGDVDGVEGWLDAAEAGLERPSPWTLPATGSLAGATKDREEEVRSLPALIAIYRASVAQARGDTAGTVSNAKRALALSGPNDHFSHGAAAGFVGLAAWAAGDLAAAVETFTDAIASLHAAGMVDDALGAQVVLANMWLARGRPDEARRLYERALAEVNTQRRSVLSTTGDLHIGLADIHREQGDLDSALGQLEVARKLGDRASVVENRHRYYTATAALLQAKGDLDAAIAMLDRAETLFRPGYLPDLRPIAASRARVHISQGRFSDARRWARQHRVAAADAPTYLAEYNHLTLARLLIAEGDAPAAIDLLDRLIEVAQAENRAGSLIEATLLRALAHQVTGDISAAAADLAGALTSGVPAGYCRIFLDEGQPMVELLDRAALSASHEVRVLAKRLLAIARGPAARALAGSDSEEGLSDRELHVLRLLATDLSGPEIARELYVSLNTLRTHTKHIFAKLGVNTRRAAVSRAAELGLR